MFYSEFCGDTYNKKRHSYSFYYNTWKEILFAYATKLFSYNGELFEKIPSNAFEVLLLTRGKSGVCENKKGELIVAEVTLSGVTDYYFNFLNFNYNTPRESGMRTIGADGVLCENNTLRNPVTPIIHMYACQLAHLDVSIITHAINTRETAVYSAITESNAQGVREYRQKLYEGKLDVLVDKGFQTVQMLDNLSTKKTGGTLKELIDAKNDTLSAFLELFGVKRANLKRERQISDEINANDTLLHINIDDMLSSRAKALIEIERMFGVKGTVECLVKDRKEINSDEKTEYSDNSRDFSVRDE